MSNTISIAFFQTRFAGEPHPVLAIDGLSLDLWLAQHLSDSSIEGLVPAQKWLEGEYELDLAWRRISPAEPGLSTIVPLLVCPDDQDLACSVIVAEQETTESTVIWRRFGYALDQDGDQVGARVRWFDKAGLTGFDKAEFLAALDQLRQAWSGIQPPPEQERCSVLLSMNYLVELPETMLEAEYSDLDRLESYLSGLGESVRNLQLFSALKLSWCSSQRTMLDPGEMNCARCQVCGQWTTDREAPEPMPELCPGAVVDGALLCDECLPQEHPQAF
ncbi:MAG: hypothetical protein ACAI44_27895 [Candidatus Sericytochromatia bacterium]